MRRIVQLPLILSLLAALFFLSHSYSQSAHADDPDFSNVNDMLAGRSVLFPDDDLVVTGTQPPNGQVTTSLYETDSDTIAPPIGNTISGPSNFVTGIGRMFNTPNDVVVTVVAGQVQLFDAISNGGYNHTFFNNLGGGPMTQHVIAKGDFTGSGYDGFAFIENGNINVFVAANVNDETQGFLYAKPAPLPTLAGSHLALAAGDFDGNGSDEVALAGYGFNTITVAIYKVQVSKNGQVPALSLKQIGLTTLSANNVQALALTAGVYNASVNPNNGMSLAELVLMYQAVGQFGAEPVTLQPIAVAATANPPQVALNLAPAFTVPNTPGGLGAFDLESGYLDFYNNTEQLVLLLQGTFGCCRPTVYVLTLDNLLNVSVASMLTPGGKTFANSYWTNLALGNFDQPKSQSTAVALEIAVFGVQNICLPQTGLTFGLQVLHIDPTNNYALTLAPATASYGTQCMTAKLTTSLTAGDVQGRSLHLRPPTKLTVDHIQPQLVLGTPPSHVDYITPNNAASPEIFNFSADSGGYQSTYQVDQTSSDQSATQGTTSFTNAAQESITGGYKFSAPSFGSVSLEVGESAGFMLKKSTAKQYGTYSASGFDASSGTGDDDKLWFREETHYIYIYPVIGQSVCPADNPSCTPPQKVPMVLMLSGPTISRQQKPNGGAVEWYQPVHESNNLFSYPWDMTQLNAQEGNINVISNQSGTFYTDTSTDTAKATWNIQGSTDVAASDVSNVNWSAFLSFTKTPPKIGGGSSFSVKTSYNGSKQFSTLNTHKTVLGQSTGIGVIKPGTFPNPPIYSYSVTPLIYGDNPVSGTVQTINVNTPVSTTGILRSGFLANPYDSSAGAWWSPSAYPLPDIAVAHPARWTVSAGPAPANIPANCLLLNTNSRNVECATFNSFGKPNTPNDDWTTESYWMKGLLITPFGANGEGPQITTATAGDKLLLQARVYNDSLTDMPAGSQIVVQFYGEPFDQVHYVPTGNSVLINTVSVAALPAFESQTTPGDHPNWQLASTTFDTTPYNDKYLAFWVVVYGKDSQGHLLTEMPAHGLTAIPPTLADISDSVNFLQPYSNNVGLYKSLFYVGPRSVQTVAPASAGLSMDNVKVSASKVILGDKVTIEGLVHAQRESGGLSIAFDDHKAGSDTETFDIDEISHIRANDAHLIKTVYHADSCGTHTLTLSGLALASLGGQATVTVTIDPLKSVHNMVLFMKQANNRQPNKDLIALLHTARREFKNGKNSAALQVLKKFQQGVQAQKGKTISDTIARSLFAHLNQVSNCVQP